MLHEVFVSHGANDKAIAEAICDGLDAAGVTTWMAPRDIVPSAEYPTAIIQAISSCRLMIVDT